VDHLRMLGAFSRAISAIYQVQVSTKRGTQEQLQLGACTRCRYGQRGVHKGVCMRCVQPLLFTFVPSRK